MKVRQIDPTDDDAQRIDSVMLGWQKRQGQSFEQELRRRLGGLTESDVREPLMTGTEPDVFGPVTEPAVFEPVMTGTDPEVFSEPLIAVTEPDIPQPVVAPVEVSPSVSFDPPSGQTTTHFASGRAGKATRRTSKQWKKGPKGKRR